MPFSDVQHQLDAQTRLQRALRSGRVPHAYLMTGPEGVGKEMLAQRLAAVLLCTDVQDVAAPDGSAGTVSTWLDACGRCEDCRLLTAGNHPDFHRIHRRLNKLHPEKKVQNRKAVDLSVDVIRHFVIAKAGLRPSRGRAKVFIVVEAERLSIGAQNALLKTLEEPPGNSYLILLALSADALLATTRSRCQQISCRALPAAFVIKHLTERADVPADTARFLAELSQGSLGLARQYVDLDLFVRVPDVIKALAGAPGHPLGCGTILLDIAKEWTSSLKRTADDSEDTNAARQAQSIVLSIVSTILRDTQRASVGHVPTALEKDRTIRNMAKVATPAGVGRAIRSVGTAEYHIRRGANTSLIFDTLGVELARGLAPTAV